MTTPSVQASLPLIHGFDVVVRDGLIEFLDGGGTRLAWFPAWEHADRDLRHFISADIPMGSIDVPYEDAGEGWRIRIFEVDGFVHIFEGDGPAEAELPRSFRVPRDTYFGAWEDVIARHNPVLPLQAALPDEQEPS